MSFIAAVFRYLRSGPRYTTGRGQSVKPLPDRKAYTYGSIEFSAIAMEDIMMGAVVKIEMDTSTGVMRAYNARSENKL